MREFLKIILTKLYYVSKKPSFCCFSYGCSKFGTHITESGPVNNQFLDVMAQWFDHSNNDVDRISISHFCFIQRRRYSHIDEIFRSSFGAFGFIVDIGRMCSCKAIRFIVVLGFAIMLVFVFVFVEITIIKLCFNCCEEDINNITSIGYYDRSNEILILTAVFSFSCFDFFDAVGRPLFLRCQSRIDADHATLPPFFPLHH